MTITEYPSLEDLQIRWTRVQNLMQEAGMDACLIASSVHIYYLTGRVFGGYLYLPAEGNPYYFVQRPAGWQHERLIGIRKPEDIPARMQELGLPVPQTLGLELDQLTYNEFIRLQKVFNPQTVGNATSLVRQARTIKTPWEIEQTRFSAIKHAEVYSHIPALFEPGMTDLELQNEIEHEMRTQGSIGLFRAFGSNMDIFMGSLLAGENAEAPSPFDFALGGGGMHPSTPIGANGTLLKPGTTVMVDMSGNFTAYMTDMSRTYSIGRLPDIAYRAHQISVDMNQHLMEIGRPGISFADIYNWSAAHAEKAGLAEYFMGTKQQAKFVGHGIGIQVNELPVMTARSKDVFQAGMILAYEPKFVIPEVGAVGIENTYLITHEGIEKLTVFEESIIAI